MQMGAQGIKTLAYQTYTNGAAGSSPETFSTQAIGTAATDRRVIVSVQTLGVTTTTGITVGGIAAAHAASADSAGATAEIWIALVPTGTTADIVVTFTGTATRISIGVWSCTGVQSNVPFDTGSSTADPLTDTLNTLQGGFCISAAAGASDTTGSCSWTNATERFDDGGGVEFQSGADASGTAFGTIAPSGNVSVGVTNEVGVFATF